MAPHVTGCIDTGDSVDVIFLDFAKAFDKVSHTRLILKLRAHGIDGKLSNWIAEWLHNRIQRIGISCVFWLVGSLKWGPTGLNFGPTALSYKYIYIYIYIYIGL